MSRLLAAIRRIPWPTLILMAALIGGAPFVPEPHLIEKARWLVEGHPFRPVDWFDIAWHSWPLLLIAIKLSGRRPGETAGD
ncbi:RND transporter [Zhengella mangrovi]|uniref:RND transporter n=1 Tax=Zhengella mangrovi TaxID=1982044 RepID=A0A2G1QHT1_9HYPH|nr:RND transporter [Zhengella mangrovi]PHP65020.1 RND transporter [Zhengella mangrovi]